MKRKDGMPRTLAREDRVRTQCPLCSWATLDTDRGGWLDLQRHYRLRHPDAPAPVEGDGVATDE